MLARQRGTDDDSSLPQSRGPGESMLARQRGTDGDSSLPQSRGPGESMLARQRGTDDDSSLPQSRGPGESMLARQRGTDDDSTCWQLALRNPDDQLNQSVHLPASSGRMGSSLDHPGSVWWQHVLVPHIRLGV